MMMRMTSAVMPPHAAAQTGIGSLRCITVIQRNERNPWRMMWLFNITMLYYICVRVFGFMYFNKHKK